jgi:hemerythrin
MQKIEWNKDLQVGMQRHDNDHRAIVESINRLFEPMSETQYYHTFGDVLCDLMVGSADHLACEESHLCNAGFPRCEEVRDSNFDYLEKIANYAMSMREKNIDELKQVSHFLRDWWLHHIQIDRQSSEYFSSGFSCR